MTKLMYRTTSYIVQSPIPVDRYIEDTVKEVFSNDASTEDNALSVAYSAAEHLGRLCQILADKGLLTADDLGTIACDYANLSFGETK